ncbi:UNVERIFIED_CONTAM: hypothetical protein HHA_450210 [Hammondia hammondi]|eukprot:XP_008889151.1 hypothetical protein HHA_450210 [Hammondia hammondi]
MPRIPWNPQDKTYRDRRAGRRRRSAHSGLRSFGCFTTRALQALISEEVTGNSSFMREHIPLAARSLAAGSSPSEHLGCLYTGAATATAPRAGSREEGSNTAKVDFLESFSPGKFPGSMRTFRKTREKRLELFSALLFE